MINEVTTGVGQTGKWFGFQHYGFTPDIVALGKGIGNGYPVSVTALAPHVIELLGERPVLYAQSHQNDPLGATIAREVVRTIREEKLIERCKELSDLLLTGLSEIAAHTDKIKEIRGRGLLAAVDLVDDTESSLTIQVHHELLRRGYIVGRRPGVNVLRLDPSLTIARQDLESFMVTLEDILV
jgi:acetylornithine aminotransferase